MPIISTIGRRSFRIRALIAMIYFLLTAGAATMVYPFLLMVAGSTKSAIDTPDAELIPRFLVDSDALYRKHVEGFFNESLAALNTTYSADVASFLEVRPPAPATIVPRYVDAWRTFLEETPLAPYTFACGYAETPVSRRTVPSALRQFKLELSREFDGDIRALNAAMQTSFHGWNGLWLAGEDYLVRRSNPGEGAFYERFVQFKQSQPLGNRYYFSTEGFFKTAFLQVLYGKKIDGYNQANGTSHDSWDAVHLDRTLPVGTERTDQERRNWTEFVRTILNLRWLRAAPEAAPQYRAFLEAKYLNIEALNRNYGTSFTGFSEIPLVTDLPGEGVPLSDWDAFVQGWRDPETGTRHALPADRIRIDSVETRFRDTLQARYGTLQDLNDSLGTSFGAWEQVLPPQQALHYEAFVKNIGAIRREFVTRNFVSVTDYIVLHGRAIVNTAVYCLLAILCTLTINPLAAYALSRYRPPSTYKLLLFLMLTMAFPPMVTQIPNFLLLRELGLLNTFWALVLPGIANGYSIFLLKGFFDSLPKELYEAAEIDGAGEFRIFWQITMSLSKPILAVIALQAFTHAYSNFMMALLICQDEKMWTLMPWLYQLQQGSGQGVIYSSLLIAAIPTFVIFVLCQNVIMRGIVVPVEK